MSNFEDALRAVEVFEMKKSNDNTYIPPKPIKINSGFGAMFCAALVEIFSIMAAMVLLIVTKIDGWIGLFMILLLILASKL